MGKFKEGDEVVLIEDSGREIWVVQGITDKISKGPLGQFPPSPVYNVKDGKGKLWQFREDSLTKYNQQ